MPAAIPRPDPLHQGWIVSPDIDEPEVTHAVASDSSVAVCGQAVVAQGGPWPSADALARACEQCTVLTN